MAAVITSGAPCGAVHDQQLELEPLALEETLLVGDVERQVVAGDGYLRAGDRLQRGRLGGRRRGWLAGRGRCGWLRWVGRGGACARATGADPEREHAEPHGERERASV